MKVCAIGLRGLPGVMGGIETHCEVLYPMMVEQDEDLEIYVLGRQSYLPAGNTSFRGIHVVPIHSWKNKYLETFIHTLAALLYARFVIRPDVIHLHAIGPGLFCPLARLLGFSVISTNHGADYNRDKWGATAKAVLRLGEVLSVRFSNRVIVVGRSLSQQLRQKYPRCLNRIEYIPNGMPDRSAEAEPSAATDDVSGKDLISRFGLESGGYILAIGRLVPEKGFQDLVAAFLTAGLDKKLVIVGSADHDDAFSRSLLTKASDRVVFTGFQSGATLDALRRHAGLFVLPSYHEGMPIAALEALSAQLPVLLSDIHANRDIGLSPECYFPVGDVESLAAKLKAPDIDAYRCRSEVLLAEFDWRKIARRTVEVFRATTIAAPIGGRRPSRVSEA